MEDNREINNNNISEDEEEINNDFNSNNNIKIEYSSSTVEGNRLSNNSKYKYSLNNSDNEEEEEKEEINNITQSNKRRYGIIMNDNHNNNYLIKAQLNFIYAKYKEKLNNWKEEYYLFINDKINYSLLLPQSMNNEGSYIFKHSLFWVLYTEMKIIDKNIEGLKQFLIIINTAFLYIEEDILQFIDYFKTSIKGYPREHILKLINNKKLSPIDTITDDDYKYLLDNPQYVEVIDPLISSLKKVKINSRKSVESHSIDEYKYPTPSIKNTSIYRICRIISFEINNKKKCNMTSIRIELNEHLRKQIRINKAAEITIMDKNIIKRKPVVHYLVDTIDIFTLKSKLTDEEKQELNNKNKSRLKPSKKKTK